MKAIVTAKKRARKAREVCGHGLTRQSLAHYVYGMCQGPRQRRRGRRGEEVMCGKCDEEDAAQNREAEEADFLREVERRAGASREEMLKSSVRWPFAAQALLRRILGEKP